MSDHHISRTDSAPESVSPWEDTDRLSTALWANKYAGVEIRDALADYLAGYRSDEDKAEFLKRIEAIGDDAMERYMESVSFNPGVE